MDYEDIYLAISIIHSSLNLDLYILTRYAKQTGFFWYQPKEIKHLNDEVDDRELLVTQRCDLLKLKYIFVSYNSAMILLFIIFLKVICKRSNQIYFMTSSKCLPCNRNLDQLSTIENHHETESSSPGQIILIVCTVMWDLCMLYFKYLEQINLSMLLILSPLSWPIFAVLRSSGDF